MPEFILFFLHCVNINRRGVTLGRSILCYSLSLPLVCARWAGLSCGSKRRRTPPFSGAGTFH